MRKLDFNFDSQALDKYINEIKSKLPEYDVNVNNVNDFQIMLEEKSNCTNCKGLSSCKNSQIGYRTNYENNNFVLNECKYKKEERIKNNKESLIKTLYLPSKILEASLSDYHTNTESRKKIYSSITEFIYNYKNNSHPKGIYLYGTFSIGKTYTLASIANELSKNDISCLLIYFPDLVVDLKNAINSDRFESLINMLKSVDVLMLDDLGSENMTPWIRDEILGPVLNYRVLEEKPVFISSNIYPGDLKNHLAIDKTPSSILKAERLISRMNALMSSINMDDGQRYKR